MHSTRTAEITIRDGVIVVTVRDQVTQHLVDAQQNYATVEKMAASKACPLLIDMRKAAPLTSEARHFYAEKRMDSVFTCLGLLLHASPVGRMLGNVYFQIARHRIPVKLFTDEAKAWEWLISNKK